MIGRFAPAAVMSLVMLAGACADPTKQPPPVPPDAIPAGTVQGSALIKGRAVYEGQVKQPEPINMASDAACHKKAEGIPRKEDLVVGAGGALKNAFVYVLSGLDDRAFAPPSEPISLDQWGCTYRPRVMGIQVGQPLLLINSDPTLHNVHTLAKQNVSFNFGMSVEGQKATRYFHKPEVMVTTRCDVHPWMAAYIGVVSHPYFDVTGEDGIFSIQDLPAGDYVIETWHETLGRLRQDVKVSDGEQREIVLTFPD